MNVGESITFNYTGGIQSMVIENAGIYELDVYGGQGGKGRHYNGALGGRSKGYIKLDAGTTLYICVGGKGTDGGGSWGTKAGGYNGGGNSRPINFGGTDAVNGAGGGATHIALVSGTLAQIGYAEFVTNHKGLIVAGGAGGSSDVNESRDDHDGQGGTGGGLTGGQGYEYQSPVTELSGATQTNGYAFGQGESQPTNGDYNKNAPAGGGLYGGWVTRKSGWNYNVGGGGGSGWIDGVPTFSYKDVTYSPETINGINEGNGKAIITFIAKGSAPVYLGNTQIDAIYLGETPIDEVYLGNTLLS